MSILKVKNPTTGEWEEIVTIVGPTGPAGPQGPQGEQGLDGKNGITPHIGDNGNWFIGETDTEMPSQGETVLQEAVLYTPQLLTEEQKAQVIQNVGAVPAPMIATVGQTVVVKAVDENGVPTEWEAADLPSGGGTQWKLINTITTTEDALARVTCTVDSNSKPFSLTEVYVKAVLPISTTATGSNFFYLNGMYFNGPTAGSKIGYGSLYANGILNQVSSVNGEYAQWHLHGGRGIPNAPYITKVELCGQSGGKNIPIGTILEIYGR